MTHLEAIGLLAEISTDLDTATTHAGDAESCARLRARLLAWGLIEQLAPVALLFAKAWLESSPSSEFARPTLVGLLHITGQPAEADWIESGNMPQPFEETSESNLAWSRANSKRSAEYEGE